MNASKVKILIILLLFPVVSFSQQFWNLTNEFWGGPKTGITLVNDSVLLVGTTTGVLKSSDEGKHFDKVLTASSVNSIFASSNGNVFAGGTGKIYFSDNMGTSWDSVTLNTGYPVKQIIENNNYALFAITGERNSGDGVFYSEDNGKSWESRNNGLGNLKGCKKIAADKNDRLYLTMSDEASTGNGGLFFSETSGLEWEKVSIKLDSINEPVRITAPAGLTISPEDSLYLSFYGVATNYMVQLNISKSINDVPLENPWQVFHVNKTSKWWEDRPLNNIHFSQSGDRYSSFTQMLNQGATYYLKASDTYWYKIDNDLGASDDGWRYEQIFAETESGRIFMIQYLDERIYTTDKSLITDINPPVKNPALVHCYPNPVKAGGKLFLQLPSKVGSTEISICDLTGKRILLNSGSSETPEITAPLKAGVYILTVRYLDAVFTEKIMVN